MKDHFYKKILKLLMGEMYHDPMVVYREYIQNACDSIESAYREGVISDRSKAMANISVKSNSVIISDNGTGVSKDNVAKLLLGISAGEKDGINTIGKYGVGRLTGAKYCKKLIFETSFKGEPVKSQVVWDIVKYQSLMDNPDIEFASDVIEKCTTCTTSEYEDVDEHYFRVILENVTHKSILDVENIKNYLTAKTPLDYIDTFKDSIVEASFDLNPDLENRLGELKCYNVTVNTTNLLYKFFRSEVRTQNEKIRLTKQNYFVINDYIGKELAWGWYAFPLSIKQINNCPFVGIQARKHNMVVGYTDLLEPYLGKAKPYITGELFVTHEAISPSSSRDGFEDSDEATELFDLLKRKFKIVYNNEIDVLSRFRDIFVEKTLLVLKERNTLKHRVQNGMLLQSELDKVVVDCNQKLDAYADYLRGNKLNTPFLIQTAKDIVEYYTQKINETLEDGIEPIDFFQEDSQRRTDRIKEITGKKSETIGATERGKVKEAINNVEPENDVNVGGNAKVDNNGETENDSKNESDDEAVKKDKTENGSKSEDSISVKVGSVKEEKEFVDAFPKDYFPRCCVDVKIAMNEVESVIYGETFSDYLTESIKNKLWKAISKHVQEKCEEKSY